MVRCANNWFINQYISSIWNLKSFWLASLWKIWCCPEQEDTAEDKLTGLNGIAGFLPSARTCYVWTSLYQDVVHISTMSCVLTVTPGSTLLHYTIHTMWPTPQRGSCIKHVIISNRRNYKLYMARVGSHQDADCKEKELPATAAPKARGTQ